MLGLALPSANSDSSNMLHSSAKAMEDVVELAKTAIEKASSALGTLHEGFFSDKEMPMELEALADSFDSDGGFLADFARDHTVRGLETTWMVLLGHGVSIDFDSVASEVLKISGVHARCAVELARKL